jgi:glycogen(starch) synthase
MRVLMFGWEFPPFQAGGLATATHGLVKGLLARGIEVTLVVPFASQGSELGGLHLVSAAGTGPGLRTVQVASPLQPYAGVEEYAVLGAQPSGTSGRAVYGRDLFAEVERYAEVAAAIAADEPHDLIDTHDWITFAAGERARTASGRPMVAHIHATEYDRCGGPGHPEIHRRERAGMLAADRVISNSAMLRRRVEEEYGVPGGRVDVVHFGIDAPADAAPLDEVAVVKDRPTVLFLGRVTRQKGPEYFVEVARRVADHVPEAEFVLAGTGDLLPRVIERTLELDLAERVHFAGAVGGSEVDRLYQAADVCVMPSVSEPLGLVALESLRNGTPCIIPRTSGVSEVVRHAFRADYWDVEDTADKVVGLLRQPELWEEMSAAGRAETHSARLGLEEAARKTAAVYRRVLDAALPVR